MQNDSVDITQQCMYAGIEEVKPGATLGDVGAIQVLAEKNYYSVVRDYCGHGIGTIYHEEPQVMHYGKKGSGLELKEGMCFTVEPMINLGSYHTRLLDDGWTVVTKDGKLSAQWEHTIAVTSEGFEILTLRRRAMNLPIEAHGVCTQDEHGVLAVRYSKFLPSTEKTNSFHMDANSNEIVVHLVEDEAIEDIPTAWLKLYLLSLRYFKPNELNFIIFFLSCQTLRGQTMAR